MRTYALFAAIAHVIAKRIFLCNTLVCFHNQMCNECSDQDNHNQAGDEAIAQRAGCDQCTNLVYEECDCEACCELQTNAAEQPFFALDFRVSSHPLPRSREVYTG